MPSWLNQRSEHRGQRTEDRGQRKQMLNAESLRERALNVE